MNTLKIIKHGHKWLVKWTNGRWYLVTRSEDTWLDDCEVFYRAIDKLGYEVKRIATPDKIFAKTWQQILDVYPMWDVNIK